MMNLIYESIALSELMDKLMAYLQREEISLDPSLRKTYSKIDPRMLSSYLEGLKLDITLEKSTSFSYISSSKISCVAPTEALYVLYYVSEYFPELEDTKIQLFIHSRQQNDNLKHREYLHLITSMVTMGKNMKMDIAKIDENYPVEKDLILGMKKSATGTLLNIQHTKYFKPKHNKTPFVPIPIEELVTDTKNYLIAEEDEIIVVKCPTCKNKLTFNYQTIETYLTLKKNTVTLQCNHPKTTHHYSAKHYTFELPEEIIRPYSKKSILMYVINNKEYYGLSLHKKNSDI